MLLLGGDLTCSALDGMAADAKGVPRYGKVSTESYKAVVLMLVSTLLARRVVARTGVCRDVCASFSTAPPLRGYGSNRG